MGLPILAAVLTATPALAQDDHRIWATVSMADGQVHEGFLRWDRNEGSWVDILDGWKEIPEEVYDVWRDAWRAGEAPTRTIELKGYRITWDEDDPDFPRSSQTGVRFGHLASLRPIDDVRTEVTFKSGRTLILEARSSDLGWGMRDLTISDRSGDDIDLEWGDLEEVRFGGAPSGASAEGERLYGTVRDQSGHEIRGFLSWDLDEILTTDILDGYEDGRDREIPFGEVVSIARHLGGANVTLENGRTLYLRGTNDVGRGHRGVQISVPGMGGAEVEWEDLDQVTFEAPPAGVGYDGFDGGAPLHGTIRMQDGEEVTGLIRWNGDVEESWEFLEGMSGDAAYRVEFGFVESIERGELEGARVRLTNGQVLELEGRSDVNWDNRGIFVLPEAPADTTAAGGTRKPPASWRLIRWDAFDQAWFGSATPDARTEGTGS